MGPHCAAQANPTSVPQPSQHYVSEGNKTQHRKLLLLLQNSLQMSLYDLEKPWVIWEG